MSCTNVRASPLNASVETDSLLRSALLIHSTQGLGTVGLVPLMRASGERTVAQSKFFASDQIRWLVTGPVAC